MVSTGDGGYRLADTSSWKQKSLFAALGKFLSRSADNNPDLEFYLNLLFTTGMPINMFLNEQDKIAHSHTKCTMQ